MKKVKRLNIKDKPGYYFMNMTNVNDFNVKLLLINEFTIFENGSIMFDISYCGENNVACIVFNNVECVFRKGGVFSYLIFRETEKNKKMLDKYTNIIVEIKERILFITGDENECKNFIMSKDFMRFRFKTNDNLVYNQKISVPACVISISSVFLERNWYYPRIELQDCFYENSD